MRSPLSQLLVITTLTACFGCGGETTTTTTVGSGGRASPGGQTQSGRTSSVGGAKAHGGTSSTGNSTAAAGQPAEVAGGAGPGSGGTPSDGGTRALGGATSPAVGGSVILIGGTSFGGLTSTGGTRNNGGVQSTGGASTGGRIASGGIPATGDAGAGSSSAAGTTITAGTSAIGGTSAAGGSFSAGGSATVWPKKFCGNTTTNYQVNPTGLNFAKHWDQITPENEGKWGSVQSSATSAFNWTRLDAIYAHAEQNGLIFKEHTFVWGSAQPSGHSAATVEAWIKAFCARYPKTALIDVVNEPPPHTTPAYATSLGQGEAGTYPWITKSFKLARRYCGNAVLILNDYNNIEYAAQEQHFIDIVKDIRAAGAPIDAVGAQAHDAYKLTASQLQANLEKLATETGLPVYITEYDVNVSSDTDQRDIFAAQFPIFWNSSAVRSVTVWGWVSGYTWMNYTGLVTGTTPRPAMTWLMEYLGRPTPP